jgi:hypothetical protein
VCFGTIGVVLGKSGDIEIRTLTVYIVRERHIKEVLVGRMNIYTAVPGSD